MSIALEPGFSSLKNGRSLIAFSWSQFSDAFRGLVSAGAAYHGHVPNFLWRGNLTTSMEDIRQKFCYRFLD